MSFLFSHNALAQVASTTFSTMGADSVFNQYIMIFTGMVLGFLTVLLFKLIRL